MILFLDTETRSPIPLAHSTAKYATAGEVIIASWAIDYGEPRVWDRLHKPRMPDELDYVLDDADEVWASNAYFDRTLGASDLDLRRRIPMSKWRCSMALLLAHGLPGGLDKGSSILGVPPSDGKQDGKMYINLFCKPNKQGEFNDATTHPAEWKEFLGYAKGDIPPMQWIHQKCPKWNYGGPGEVAQRETRLWHLDQRINDRGFAVDVEMAEAMVRATTAEKKRLGDRTMELTGGFVERATQRDRLLRFLLLEYGVTLPDMKADTIERRLEDPELPEYIKEILRIRLQSTKASTAKYRRLLNGHVGGRLYGTLQYCAANRTGRWGGRIFQPHNLPRPSHKFHQIKTFIDAVKLGVEDLCYGPGVTTDDQDEYEVQNATVMAHASSSLRSVIVAGPGKKLDLSDLSNIEGRKMAWLAGEEWKLDAFRAFDDGTGPDLYKVSYSRSFGVEADIVEDDSPERQIGKVQELSLQYQGGVNAFVTMSATYDVDLEEMAIKARPAVPESDYRDALGVWAWAKQQRRTFGLSQDVYVICEALKSLWRAAHPMIEAYWENLETAARSAIQNPGIKFTVRNVVFSRQGGWLRIRLPSGRIICYAHPKVEGNKISYMAVNVYSKTLQRTYTYGGKIAENITQASARDVLADAMPRAEDQGYTTVLSVHDELMTENDIDGPCTHQELSKILAQNSAWNVGLPLAAKGFTTLRYKKS